VSGLLPNAQLVVDLLHVVPLATTTTTVDDVRRRVTYTRRGRAGDLEYTIKNLLGRGQDRLSRNPSTNCCVCAGTNCCVRWHKLLCALPQTAVCAGTKLLCALADLGDAGRQIGAAWRANEFLRNVTKLSPNTTGLAATRDKVTAGQPVCLNVVSFSGGDLPTETSAWRYSVRHRCGTVSPVIGSCYQIRILIGT
jgi:transposase